MSKATLPSVVDVVVVGGGLAGCAAALAAAESGSTVLQIEKLDDIGGSTVLSAGLSAFAGSVEQEAQGIEDSVELLREDILTTGGHKSDERLVDVYCERQLDTYNWLKKHGVKYGHVHAASGQTVPRSHPTDTRQMLKLLSAAAAKLGAQLVTNARALRLVRENNRVVGITIQVGDTVHTVTCGAVILCAGGFSQNPQMLAQFAPQMAKAVTGGGAGSQGDGIRMAWQLGAAVIDTQFIKGTYGIYPTPLPEEKGTGILAVYMGAIAVNHQGLRFIDESLPYKVLGDASLMQPGGTTFQIWDSKVMAQSDDEVPIYDLASREKNGLLIVADSIEELAARIDVPADALKYTVERYNDALNKNMEDEYSRKHLSGGVGKPTPLDTPPYYCQPSSTVVLATYCGLSVTPDCEVLDVFDTVIPGLFTAGEMMGGFHGGGYMTGTSIGKAGVFGRVAGQNASEFASKGKHK